MPRCGGCGGVCGCLQESSASVAVSGNGQPTTPWSPSVRRSSVIGNSLQEFVDGLFVGNQTPAPSVVADTNTINLSGDGTFGTPLNAVFQPAPYAHVTGTGTIASTTAGDITLGTTVELTGLTYSAPSVTVSSGNGGLYAIEASAAFAFSTAGTIRALYVFVNGVFVKADVRPPFTAGTFATYLGVSVVLRLAAGATVKLQAEQNSGNTLNVDRALRLTRTGI